MKRILLFMWIVLMGMAVTACGGSGGNGANPDSSQGGGGPFDGEWIIAAYQGVPPIDTLSIQTSQIVAMKQLTIADDQVAQTGSTIGQISQNDLSFEIIDGTEVISATGSFNGDLANGTWAGASGASGSWEGRKATGGITAQWDMRKKDLYSLAPIEISTWLALMRTDGNLLLGHTADSQFYAGSATFDGHIIDGSMDGRNGTIDFSCFFLGSYINGTLFEQTSGDFKISGFKTDEYSNLEIDFAYVQYTPQIWNTGFFVALKDPNGNPPPPDIVTSVEVKDPFGNIWPKGLYYQDAWHVNGWNCDTTCEFSYEVFSGVGGNLPDQWPTGECTLIVTTPFQTISKTVMYEPNRRMGTPSDPEIQFDLDGNLTVTWNPNLPDVKVRLYIFTGDPHNYHAQFLISDSNQTSFQIPAQVIDQMNVTGQDNFIARLSLEHYTANADGSYNESTLTHGRPVNF